MGPDPSTPQAGPLPADPVISVVVPTYQHARFIRACISSILAQRTDLPFEVLLGEDGSTDGTREICQELAAAHPDRIRLFLNDRRNVIHINGHPTGRWNALNLLRHCRGRYIATCEGDDLWTDPEKLALQVAVLESDPSLSGSYHRTAVIDDEGRPTGKDFVEDLAMRIDMPQVISRRAAFHTSSLVFRNLPFLRRPPAWTRQVGSMDMVLFALCADRGPLAGIPRLMSAYRKHIGGITSSGLHRGALFDHQRILLWLHLDSHLRGRWAKEMGTVMEAHFEHLVRHTSRRERLHYLWAMLRQDPGYVLSHPRRFTRWGRQALRRPR